MYKSLLYNEEEQAKNIFDNGFTNDEYNRREAFLLCKYFRHVLKYGDIRIRKRLVKFCEGDKTFNEVLESSIIKQMIRNSKNKFIVREGIFITQNEINRIRKVKNFSCQKLYLGLLSFAKKNKSNFVSIKTWTSVKRISDLKNLTLDEMYSLIHILYENKLVYPSQRKIGRNLDAGHRLLFIDWNSLGIINIYSDSNLYNLGKEYERYCGGVLQYCEECGKEFVRMGKAHKLCEEHSKEAAKNRQKRWKNGKNEGDVLHAIS